MYSTPPECPLPSGQKQKGPVIIRLQHMARSVALLFALGGILGTLLGSLIGPLFWPAAQPLACSIIHGSNQDPKGPLDATPFYTVPSQSAFRKTAFSVKPVTDKVGPHAYDALYSLYFEAQGRRMQRLKLLEIGLGCDSHYGPTASIRAWRKYLPHAELWVAEYDTKCLQRQAGVLADLRVQTISGDQGDNATLRSWVQQTGGNFDVIIDDGGHQNHQQYNTFGTLFPTALKPGGIFFIEDLQISRQAPYRGLPGSPIMAAVITDWIESLLATAAYGNLSQLTTPGQMRHAYATYKAVQASMTSHGLDSARLPTWRLPAGVKLIHCQSEMCAVTKCALDDPYCPLGVGKQSAEGL